MILEFEGGERQGSRFPANDTRRQSILKDRHCCEDPALTKMLRVKHDEAAAAAAARLVANVSTAAPRTNRNHLLLDRLLLSEECSL